MPKPVPLLFGMLCVAVAVAFTYFAHLAAFESIPAYSTLNSGPKGAKLLFDSLNEAQIVPVARQFKSLAIQKPHNATVFFLAAQPSAFEELKAAARTGNRVIASVTDARLFPFVSKTWLPLETGVFQHTYGRGEVIVITDAARLTNKGIATSAPDRQLFTQLLIGHPAALFEEAHLGIRETGSIAGLARHYRLQGLLLGLVLLAGMFIWSRSVSFPPAPEAIDEAVAGSDTRSLLTELMSRHLKDRLVAACVAEWNRTRGHAPAIEVPAETNPVAAYAQLQELLAGKSRFQI